MSIYQDLLTYYQNNPLADIDEQNLPLYVATVEKVLSDTLLEYSKYKPIYETKEVVPTTDKIDIYVDISNLIIDLLYFQEKDLVSSDLSYIKRKLGYKLSRNLNTNSSSLLQILSDYEYVTILKEYLTITVERRLVGGRYITNLKPNTTYIAAFTRFRTTDELTLADKNDFEKLFVLNLVDAMYTSTKFMGETVLRSVSISGMSISFGFPSIEQTKKYIQEQKQNLLKKIAGDDFYLPEIF